MGVPSLARLARYGDRGTTVLAHRLERRFADLAVGVTEQLGGSAGMALDGAPAVADLAFRLRRRERSEDGMGHGVRADAHHLRIEALELRPCSEVEFLSLGVRRYEGRRRRANLVFHSPALGERQLLHPLDEFLELVRCAELVCQFNQCHGSE